MTRPPAPALTAEEARTVARFDAAPVPPEVVAAGERVETVARAIWAADGFPGPTWEDDAEGNREDYRRLAAAAIAADPSPVRRWPCDYGHTEADHEEAGACVRAALASPAPAPQGEHVHGAWCHPSADGCPDDLR